MKKIILLFVVAVMLTFTMNSKADATTVDTIDNSNMAAGDYFLDFDSNKYDSPYYRKWDEDWDWQHNAIAETVTTATLSISAWDVDLLDGEIDNIYAWDNGVKTLIGSLGGSDNTWDFTTFNLGNNFFDDIATGLRVEIDIDSTNQIDVWYVTLAKSTLCINGGPNDPTCSEDPNPPVVPEPSTYLLLGSGIAGLAYWRRRQKAKKA